MSPRPTARRAGLLALPLALLLAAPAPIVGATTEPGDTCAAATPIAPGTAWTSEALEDSVDRDWFRFSLVARTQVLITLGDLTMDATLLLQGACGTTLATSDRSGIQYEELFRTLPAGTYRIRVTAPPTVAAGRGYDLRVRPIPNRVVVLSFSAWAPYDGFPERPRVVGEVLNASPDQREDVKVRIRFFDAGGDLIASSFTWARRERMRVGQRSMFDWYGEDVPDWDHVTVSVAAAPIAGYPALTGLVAHPTGTSIEGPIVTYEGTLTNTTTFSVTVPRVMVTVYDAWGDVRQAEFQDVDPHPLPAGATTDYAIAVDGRGIGNRAVITTHGYKKPTG